MLCFWKALHKLTGIKLKMSTAYHPQTDGTSKHTNKMVNQALWYHIEWNQLGWAQALPHVHFDMMNTVNTSTSFMPQKFHNQSRLINNEHLPSPSKSALVFTCPHFIDEMNTRLKVKNVL